MFNLKKERINYEDFIFRGSSDRAVYPYQKNKDDKDWVVKHIYARNEKELVSTFEEIVLGFSCDHPGILPTKGYHIQKREAGGWNVYLKFPRMLESLQQKLERDSKVQDHYSEEQIVKYFYSLICGLEYLHKKRIAHRDIKPANILVSQEGKLVLCDVGIARFIPEGETVSTEQERTGTLAYKAPEIGNQASKLKTEDLYKADAWGLGLVMAELCLKQVNLLNWKEAALQKRENQLKEKVKSLEGEYSEHLIRLLLGLVHFEPQKRMGIEDAKKYLEENFPLLTVPESNILSERAFDCEEIFSIVQRNIERKSQGNIQLNPLGECVIQRLNQNEVSSTVNMIRGLSLRSLEIKGDRNISDTGIRKLAEQIGSSLPSIQSLNLDLSWNDMIRNSAAKSVGEEIGKELKSLQHLKLNLRNTHITDGGVIGLAEGIGKNLKSLQHLSLNFSCTEITEAGIKKLAEQIGINLKSLQHLDLAFSWTKSTDAEVRSFAELFGKNLKALQHLNLNFRGNKITDTGVKKLAEKIGINLKSLHHLNLDFRVNPITDEGIKGLAEQIGKNLKSLQHLCVYFSDSGKHFDAGIKSMAEHIGKNLPSIQTFKLEAGTKSFQNMKELTEWLSTYSENFGQSEQAESSQQVQQLQQFKDSILSFFAKKSVSSPN